MPNTVFHGSMTALVTPFQNTQLDLGAVADLTAWHREEGTNALVPVGTTGETPTLEEPERRQVVEAVITAAAGHIPVIAGVGGPNTAACIEKARHAKAEGADAALVVTPYYNRPDQEGLYAHFSAIADAVQLPLIAYDVPHRTAVTLSVETLVRLAEHPNIVGVKDATSDMARVPALRRRCGPDFALLSGEDGSALGFLAMGGDGVISVTANVAPRLFADMVSAARAGRFDEARAINDRLAPLHEALFAAPSPGPAKYALSLMKRCSPDVRLPILPPPPRAQAQIEAALELALETADA